MKWQRYWDIIVYRLAVVAVLVAAYIPARRASRLEPVEILRGTGQ